MNQSKQQSGARATFAIFSVFFLMMGIGTITPAMNSIIGHWSAQGIATSSILLVNTLPTLTQVITMLIVGVVVGKRIKYRTAAILGCACFGLFGAMPVVFTDNFTFVLVCRALFGIGLGLITPLGNALIIGLYQGNKQAEFLGYGALVMNLGGIILQMLGGILSPAADTWNLCFLAHALAFVSMGLCFFIPEPPEHEAVVEGETQSKLTPYVWVGSITLFLINLVNFSLLMNSSVWVSFTGTDNVSLIASISTSCFTVGGMISSALFGKTFEKLGNKTLSIGSVFMAVGASLMYMCGDAWILIIVGFVLDGFGFNLILPGIMAFIGMTAHPRTQTLSISIVMAVMNLGGFISTYYLMYIVAPIFQGMGHANDVTGYYYGEFIVAIVVFLAMAVFTFFHNPAKHAIAPSEDQSGK